jgi:hypothetical protein
MAEISGNLPIADASSLHRHEEPEVNLQALAT